MHAKSFINILLQETVIKKSELSMTTLLIRIEGEVNEHHAVENCAKKTKFPKRRVTLVMNSKEKWMFGFL